ncbi:MAG: ABC transporter family protein [Rickettsiales bacterium]|nr:ABC transporter family protein [Rickettsiales bacterium]
MSSKLLFSIKEGMVRFKETPVFENLSFNIHQNKRIALIGRNGAGKSTIMNIISGKKILDDGDRWEEPGTSVGYLGQEFSYKLDETVFDFIFSNLTGEERELNQYKVDIIADALELNVKKKMGMLSGGQIRRAGISRALVEEPDILLLDEPTNHLDLHIINWLESYLNSYKGSFLCISHDKTFLENITNQVFWLDRGKLKVSPKGFKFFDEWSTMLLEQEERELSRRRQIVSEEVTWASRGVKARVKRNINRLNKVKEMREKLKADESSFRRVTKTISYQPIKDLDNNSKIIAEFYNVHKVFNEDENNIKILDSFNFRIKKGDRIGIIGKNGSGKTTFLKLMLKELDADKGSIKINKNMEFSYFDQNRIVMDPKDSLKDIILPNGGDYIEVRGKMRHVYGYLKDFMFDPKIILESVSTLSGGQKNRLKLAKVLANPKSCLILDEPTNDLDMETLDMLKEILILYKGTLLLVSHDRDFLDQTVTKILAFEGEGNIEESIGGYSDYLKKKNLINNSNKKNKLNKSDNDFQKDQPEQKKSKKLSFKLEFELKNLPEKIQLLEQKIKFLNQKLADPEFYTNDADNFIKTTEILASSKAELDHLEIRWVELEEKKT